MTTNKELVRKALDNEETERVPVGFWFHFFPDEIAADALADPSVAKQSIEGHRRFIEAFRPDFVKIMSDGFFSYPTAGGQKIAGRKDLARLLPLAPDDPWIEGQVELVRTVCAMQEDSLYFYNVFSPANSLRFLIGKEALMQYLKEDPAFVAAALERMGEGLAVLAGRVIRDGGADGIYYSVQNPDLDSISDEQYRRLITPGDKLALDAANAASENNILHICGYDGALNHLEVYRDYAAKAYNWAVNVEKVSLAEGKKLFGGKAVIGGFPNPPGSLIETGTKEEIEAFTQNLLETAGKTGLIIGADCTIPRGTPLAHLHWIRDKAAAL